MGHIPLLGWLEREKKAASIYIKRGGGEKGTNKRFLLLFSHLDSPPLKEGLEARQDETGRQIDGKTLYVTRGSPKGNRGLGCY